MSTSQKQAARKFVEYWTFQRGSEKGEDQQFWNSLLRDVLGVTDVEQHIKYQVPVQLKDTTKFLDAWIPETRVLIEHKSRGVNLEAMQAGHGGLTPYEQAVEYDNARPFDEKARWIVTCNFDEFRIYDRTKPLAPPLTLKLGNLPKEAYRLAFLVNPKEKAIDRELEISVQAGRIVGEIYDALLKQYCVTPAPSSSEATRVSLPRSDAPHRGSGALAASSSHLAALNRLCVRLVFCLYAEDADIFPKDCFRRLLENTPALFLRERLIRLFQTLDTPTDKRNPYLDAELCAFPYTNGGLFHNAAESDIPPITDDLRQLLIGASQFDWRDITPTIFGALFESTLNPVTRRAGGMVYTSVENIHKVIDPLFLDDLTRRVESAIKKGDKRGLLALQAEMAALTFLDPACGSGNFLTETYICLRRLENRIIAALQKGQGELDLGLTVKVSLSQFHGLEINDFAVSVAKTALWIAEAQMRRETAEILHREPDYLPLKNYDNIIEGNALRMDWGEILSAKNTKAAKSGEVYVIGNPPFCGKSFQSVEQKSDMSEVFKGVRDYGNLDYVTCWFKKAADFGHNVDVKCAFVATNSICQGIAVPPLWTHLLDKGVEIDFVQRTFRWDNEAFDKAHVHCVIIGFHIEDEKQTDLPTPNGVRDSEKVSGVSREQIRLLKQKTIFDNGRPIPAGHINAYLMDAPDIIVNDRVAPLCDVPAMSVGSFVTDGGSLILSAEEREELLTAYPSAETFVRPYVSPEDFINNKPRYCLWLKGVPPDAIIAVPPVRRRIEAVRTFRLSSKKAQTRKRADTPTLFAEDRQPDADYILVPRVSSERRRYVPMGFLPSSVIAGDTITLPNATPYHFGVLTSSVHMSWMRLLCGRLEMRYRYSPSLVYNTLPWPDLRASASLREKIIHTARGILDARVRYPNSSFKALYDDTLMPPDLRAAHEANDKAVLAAYGLAPDTPEPEIVAHLFKLYAEKVKETK